MAFSFEPFLAISAGHIMAVSAGPEQQIKKELPFWEKVQLDFIDDEE